MSGERFAGTTIIAYMEDKKWTILKSEYLIQRPWLTARRDHVRFPDGRENPEYYVLEYPDWVNVIAITKDGHFVMERQYRHALGRTSYELPCGVMENGEEPLEAIKRELLEETGYGGGEWRHLMDISANSSTMNNMTHCFLATGVEKISEPHLDDTEELEVYLLSREKVWELLKTNQFVQALMVAPLWKFFSNEK
jgi:8-oxo-dGTP pyrophosphatase MutT (NUDIX family)